MNDSHDDAEDATPIATRTRVPPENTEDDPDDANEETTPIDPRTRVP